MCDFKYGREAILAVMRKQTKAAHDPKQLCGRLERGLSQSTERKPEA